MPRQAAPNKRPVERHRPSVPVSLFQLQKAVEASGEVIFMTDAEGMITYVNPEFTRLYGWGSEEVVGRVTPRILKSGRMPAEAYEQFWRALLGKQVVKGQIVNKRKDGWLVTVEGSSNPIIDEDGRISGFLAIQRDITENKELETLLENVHLNEVLIDSIPYPTMLVRRDRMVLAANRAAIDMGAVVGGYCWRDYGRCESVADEYKVYGRSRHAPVPADVRCQHCLGDEAIATRKTKNMAENQAFGRLWDMWWVPISSDIFLYYAIDITERRETEKRLQQTENRMRLALRQLPCVFWTTDSELRYTSVMGSGLPTAHVNAESILGRSVMEMAELLQDGADNEFLISQRDALNGKSAAFESRIGQRDFFCYVEPMYDRNKTVTGVIGIALDITEKKKADRIAAELREQVDRDKADFETVLKSVADGVFVTGMDYRVTMWSPSAERLTGWNAAEVVGRPCAEFLCGRDEHGNRVCDTPVCGLRQVSSTGSSIAPTRRLGRTASGDDVMVSTSAAPVRDAAGAITGIVVVFRDVSAEIEAERLKDTLLSNVSHELRTPLASIKGFTSTLLQTDVKFSEAEQRDFLQTIDRECDRLTRLIGDILDMSRVEGGGLKLDRSDYRIFDIIDLVGPRLAVLTERQHFQVKAPQALPPVFVDAMRIGQVLTNLVENAAKFSTPNTPIVIEADLAGEEVIVRVTDKGRGISEDALPRVFDRFYQVQTIAEGKKSGTGLGLSICRGIVEAHGGNIWVESKIGAGSCFSFSLPVSQGGAHG